MKKKFIDNYIRSLKQTSKPDKNYYVFDTETRTIKNKLVCRIIVCFKIINGEIVEQKEFNSKRDFTRYILNNPIRKKSILWAHNSSFDVRIGIDMQELNRLQYKIICFSTSPFILILDNGKHKLEFLDTMSFFRDSIENIGKYFGIEKIQIEDFNKVDDETLRSRCFNDVLVTYKTVNNLYNIMINRVCVSVPSLSYQNFRMFIREPLEKLNSELIDRSYFGGRVEVFSRLKTFCRRYDINSMYPFVMVKNNFPVKRLFTLKNPSISKIRNLTNDGFGSICEVKVKLPDMFISPFPFKRESDNKLIFPVGEYVTTLCNPELDLNYISEIRKAEVFEMKDIFSEFVGHFWDLRKNSEGIENQFYKLILNSLYGKFAQKRKDTKFYGYSNIDITDNIDIEYDNKLLKLKCINGMMFISDELERNLSTAISSFITSYSRNLLYEKYLKPYQDHIMYCDTDSITVKEICLTESKELGEVKLEKEGLAQFYAPKSYIFQDEHKFKGVPKHWEYQIIDHKLIAKGRKFSGLLENIRRFKEFGINEIYMEKEIRLLDDKRVWFDCDSKPLKI